MLLPFIAAELRKSLDQLQVSDVSGDCVRQFLKHLERTRNVSVATRNQRLAAIYSLARFIAEYSPQHVAWYGQVRTVPFKKSTQKQKNLTAKYAKNGRQECKEESYSCFLR